MQSHSCLEEKQKTQVCGNEIMECVIMCLWSRDVVCDNKYTFLSFEVRIRQKISSYMNRAKCNEPMVR